MCPACLTTAALVVAGASSAGGLTALVVKKLRTRALPKVIVTVRTRGALTLATPGERDRRSQ
jgi:hypothetical protein